jgi:hypothetical protein
MKLLSKLPKRTFACPKCGGTAVIPRAWAVGVEMVVRCPVCKATFHTGYKTGAVLTALALTGALTIANLGVWLFSSLSLILFVPLIVPIWLLLGYLMRRWWMMRKARKQ